MIHYAVWAWYHKLLALNEPVRRRWGRQYEHRERPADLRATIRSLVGHGADLHDQTSSGHTILDGMFLDLIQFDGSARPCNVITSCIGIWFGLLRDLGFDVRDYIHREKVIHDGISHDLGLGLSMEIRFSEEPDPWVWSIFHGPEERARGESVCHITHCCVWPEWQQKFALPRPPPPWPPSLRAPNPNAMVVLRSLDDSGNGLKTGETDDDPRKIDHHIRSCLSRALWIARHYAIWGAEFRFEVSFYFAAFISLLGVGYLARIWLIWIFYLSLEFLRYASM